MPHTLTPQEMTLLDILCYDFGMHWIAKDKPELGPDATVFQKKPYEDEGEWMPEGDAKLIPLGRMTYSNIMLDKDVDIDPEADHFAWLSFEDGPLNIDQLIKENEGR